MQPSHGQRQIKYGEQLTIDAAADFCFGHADFLHDAEAGLILVALRNLLVIDDENRGKEKFDAENDTKAEQAAVGAEKIRFIDGAALDGTDANSVGLAVVIVQNDIGIVKDITDESLFIDETKGIKDVNTQTAA